jgi:hypothetical protein
MNTTQSANRRVLQSNPVGAGGLTGLSVPLSDPNRTVGSIGFNHETNPMQPQSDNGQIVQFPKQDGTTRQAHFEVVQSWRRDLDNYPDPWTFRLKFANPLREVYAIEVLSVNVPNVDVGNPDPQFREFLLLNGLLRQTTPTSGEYRFRPQENIARTHSYSTMVPHNFNDPNVNYGGTDADNLQLDDAAFGRFQYDASRPFQYWRSEGGYHQTTWFVTPIPKLAFLDFTLADCFGAPYEMNATENWTATLQIISKG